MVEASVFDTSSPPMVWTPIKDRIIFGKFKRYSITYHAVCPCTQLVKGLPTDGLPTLLIEGLENISNSRKKRDRYLNGLADPRVEISKVCIDLWNKEIINKLVSLSSMTESRVLHYYLWLYQPGEE